MKVKRTLIYEGTGKQIEDHFRKLWERDRENGGVITTGNGVKVREVGDREIVDAGGRV